MKPYYESGGITLYHGDCREVLLSLSQSWDAVITDPVWPNALPMLAGANDPTGLFRETAALFAGRCARLVVHIGCDSDPRFLQAVPVDLPFLRACWLEYVRPSYKGRLMNSNDIAYVFGVWPPSRPGARVFPGRMMQTESSPRQRGHPCPRRYEHVRWLVRWFARGPVLDPFMGSGTTALAAKTLGYSFTGIEIEERYCEIAANRLSQEVMPLEIPA